MCEISVDERPHSTDVERTRSDHEPPPPTLPFSGFDLAGYDLNHRRSQSTPVLVLVSPPKRQIYMVSIRLCPCSSSCAFAGCDYFPALAMSLSVSNV